VDDPLLGVKFWNSMFQILEIKSQDVNGNWLGEKGLRVAEVPGSSPGGPTINFLFFKFLHILMKSLNVGIFHDRELGRELGKKGSETDILMFNRKKEDLIMTFMFPLKLISKVQIMSVIDVAIVSFNEITPELGETILLLDAIGVSKGFLLIPEQNKDIAKSMIKGTSLENFSLIERDPIKIIQELEKIEIKRNGGAPLIVIDQAFTVKGIGTVILGFVKSGTVKKYDKFQLLPPKKEVVVRSIQIHDKDYDQAEVGTRIGVALKGVEADEIKRGFILCENGEVSNDFDLHFNKNKFYPEIKNGPYHMVVGMQSSPIEVLKIDENLISLKSERAIACTGEDKFVLLDLNARKLHFIGIGEK